MVVVVWWWMGVLLVNTFRRDVSVVVNVNEYGAFISLTYVANIVIVKVTFVFVVVPFNI